MPTLGSNQRAGGESPYCTTEKDEERKEGKAAQRKGRIENVSGGKKALVDEQEKGI